MKNTVNFYDFERAFRDHDRYDSFGYEGLKLLFDWLEEYEESTGEEIELDVVAIDCDFYMLSLDEIYEQYIYSESCGNKHIYEPSVYEDMAHLDAHDQDNYLLDWLNDQTMVVGQTSDNQFVFQAF